MEKISIPEKIRIPGNMTQPLRLLEDRFYYTTSKLTLSQQLWENIRAYYKAELVSHTSSFFLSKIRSLLEMGLDVNTKDNFGQTPLECAVANNLVTLVKLLINHGADVNAKTKDGKTPLHIAAFYGYTDVAQLLKQHGAE